MLRAMRRCTEFRLAIARGVAVAAVAWCSGCAPDPPPPRHPPSTDPASAPVRPTVPQLEAADDAVPLGRGEYDPPVPSWPAAWTVKQASRTAARREPVLTFRWELRGISPEAATRQAIDALRQVSGPDAAHHVAPSDDGAAAVGQLRSPRLEAALSARREEQIVILEALLVRPRVRLE